MVEEYTEYPLPLAKIDNDGKVHQLDPATKETSIIWTNAKITTFSGYDRLLI